MKNSIIKNMRLAFALALVLMFSGMSFAAGGNLTGSSSSYVPASSSSSKKSSSSSSSYVPASSSSSKKSSGSSSSYVPASSSSSKKSSSSTQSSSSVPFSSSSSLEPSLGGNLTGSGTEADPFKISDAADLKAFAKGVNEGIYASAYAELADNIDMNPGKKVLNEKGELYNKGEGLEKWTPIGNSGNPFIGHFDGKNHTIRGLYFDDLDGDYAGLFGWVGKKGVVQNVGVIDSYINGKDNVGGVVGWNEGSISNVYNTGIVSNKGSCGGVVGINRGSISDVYNMGAVNGGSDVGGVVGFNRGSISDVYNMGAVNGDSHVGGVVGWSDEDSVSNAYNAGAVNGSGYVGGVAGFIRKIVVENVYNTGTVNGDSHVGGVVGYNDDSQVSDGFYAISTCPSCGGAINGKDDVKNNVIGVGNDVFAEKKIAYYIAFLDSDGKTVLQQGFVQPNEVPVAPSETVKEDNDYYHYFVKWTPEIVAATANTTYRAVIDSTPKRMELDVQAYEGSVLYINPPSKCIEVDLGQCDIHSQDGVAPKCGDLSTEFLGDYYLNYTVNIVLKLNFELEGCEGDSYSKVISTIEHEVGVYMNGDKIGYFGNQGHSDEAFVRLQFVPESPKNETVKFHYNNQVYNVLTPFNTIPSISEIPLGRTDNDYYHYFIKWDKELVPAIGGSSPSDYYGTIDSSLKKIDVSLEINSKMFEVSTSFDCIRVKQAKIQDQNTNILYPISNYSVSTTDINQIEGGLSEKAYLTIDLDESCSDIKFLHAVKASDNGPEVFINGSSSGNLAKNESGVYEVTLDKYTIETKYFITILDTDRKTVLKTMYKAYGEYLTSDFPSVPYTSLEWHFDWNGEDRVWRSDIYAWHDFVFYAKGYAWDDDGCMLIKNANELYLFAERVRIGAEDMCARLDADITVNTDVLLPDGSLNAEKASSFRSWFPVGFEYDINGDGKDEKQWFEGVFDGAGHTISGLYIDNENQYYVGLFGLINGATIKNVGIKDSYFKGKGNVGSLVGFLSAGKLFNCYNSGTVVGKHSVGGIVGDMDGDVYDCFNTGKVTGDKYVGGVIGFVDGGEAINTYNAAPVSGSSFVGCIAGSDAVYYVSDSYYNSDVCTSKAIAYNYFKYSEDLENGAYDKEDDYDDPIDDETNNVVGKTSAELAALNIGKAFKFKNGEENPWVAGSVVSNNGSVTYKFPYLAIFDEKSQPVFTPAIEFAANNASATVYGATTGSVNIPADVEVTGNILFDRSFTEVDSSAFSTMMLPFTPKSIPEGVSFYAFDGVSQKDGKWNVVMKVADSVVANTPYLVQVSSGAEAISFADGGTFKATDGEHATVSGNWKFVGTYEYKAWPENDPGIGKTYGFAGSTGNDPDIVGKFAKIAAGAYIYPMRAYLEYTAPVALARPAANGAARAGAANTVASLPNEIDVVISEKDETTGEQTTRVIGTLNTRTGEFKAAADRYFDMKGRFLGNKKPTAKGTYYYNGKKVIVK